MLYEVFQFSLLCVWLVDDIINPLKPRVQFSSYVKESTTHLYYWDELVSIVQGSVCSEKHMKPINTHCGENA
jgi:hypothetical protein